MGNVSVEEAAIELSILSLAGRSINHAGPLKKPPLSTTFWQIFIYTGGINVNLNCDLERVAHKSRSVQTRFNAHLAQLLEVLCL